MGPDVKPSQRKPRAARRTAAAPAVKEGQGVDAERQEKLARLKKSLEDGTYRVSSEDVARKVIEYMSEPTD